jgi:hypothetical protein
MEFFIAPEGHECKCFFRAVHADENFIHITLLSPRIDSWRKLPFNTV